MDEALDGSGSTSAGARRKQFYEVRYSLKEMLLEVENERLSTDQSRELVDANEIGKLFTTRKRKKKK